MAKATDKFGILYQNLVDAGCCEEVIERGMEYAKAGRWKDIVKLIQSEKQCRVTDMHTNQKQIDCLDFLAYQIEKESQKEGIE